MSPKVRNLFTSIRSLHVWTNGSYFFLLYLKNFLKQIYGVFEAEEKLKRIVWLCHCGWNCGEPQFAEKCFKQLLWTKRPSLFWWVNLFSVEVNIYLFYFSFTNFYFLPNINYSSCQMVSSQLRILILLITHNVHWLISMDFTVSSASFSIALL